MTANEASGGRGGTVWFGGTATLQGLFDISTAGSNSPGLVASSLGGIGGNGGNGGFFVGGGGSGGSSGSSSPVYIETYSGTIITTAGADSAGIDARSVAGHGGASGGDYSLQSFGASGGSAGYASTATVDFRGSITTTGDSSPAISAESIGGGSGGDGFGLFFAQGSIGGNGGNANPVTVNIWNSSGTLTTSGSDSHGIHARSIGGAGGDGGWTGGIVTVGGKAARASDGGTVRVSGVGQIRTGAPRAGSAQASDDPICGVGCSSGIVVQSIGGGGNGGTTAGFFSVGGKAGGGGNGGDVSVVFGLGSIRTSLVHSYGIFAQSLGGGGGDGGATVAAGPWVSTAIGGSGGAGGSAGDTYVKVDAIGTDGPIGSLQPTIITEGDESPGVFAQSLGGGGGTGGDGGSAGSAIYTNETSGTQSCCVYVTTSGDDSPGVVVASEGGGGGRGSYSIAAAAGVNGLAGSFAVGGSGGEGGNGCAATAWSNSIIRTAGVDSPGLDVASVGGGGGDGGMAISGTVNYGPGGVAIAVGGSGGYGGAGGDARVTSNTGNVSTTGAYSDGIVARSTGGGGGNGGLTISGALGVQQGANFALSVGGSGGLGGNGGQASIDNYGDVTTTGVRSRPIVAQSEGGGGGNASMTIGGVVTASGANNGLSFPVVVGGRGDFGGDGEFVRVENHGTLISSTPGDTTNAGGQGILAQSIGGGGSGSWVASLSASLGAGGGYFAPNIAYGGEGGAGGNGGYVISSNYGAITTYGPNSEGIKAESTGGGGGNVGGIVSLTLTGVATFQGAGGYAGSVAIGQSGGGGGSGGAVILGNYNTVTTLGAYSHALSANSRGGGGGDAGYIEQVNLGAGISVNNAANVATVAVTIGGDGGDGRPGGRVSVTNEGALSTSGDKASGIQAQSHGGGGGNSSYALAVALTPGIGLQGAGITVGLGGSGGKGATGSAVSVTNRGGAISTAGNQSHGIDAQSIGGGGGNASTFISTSVFAPYKMAITVGGDGGTGHHGDTVDVDNAGMITLTGNNSAGILARSVGGGGGGSRATSVSVSGTYGSPQPEASLDATVTVGNKGAGGGSGGTVTVNNSGAITTSRTPSSEIPSAESSAKANNLPIYSSGILAQSVGVGGGDGGSAFALALGSNQGSNPISSKNQLTGKFVVGGEGASGGSGDDVTVNNYQSIVTHADGAIPIFAQSVGGGGGTGGNGASLSTFPFTTLTLNAGGMGGAAGDGGAVSVTSAFSGQPWGLRAFGESAAVIYAQSIGGGGGRGGVGVVANSVIQAVVGGQESSSGNGGAVTVSADGAGIQSTSSHSPGIWAQSVGGGGGHTGGAGAGIVDTPVGSSPPKTIGYIPSPATVTGIGNGGRVEVTHNNAKLDTSGDDSIGIFAQSVGGGGGVSGQTSADCKGTCSYTVGSTGGTGDGGHVTVTLNNAGVYTTGQYSHGIFAQSAGGKGSTAGEVAVNLQQSDVFTTGNSASAIFADSSAGGANGKITIAISAGSTVSGGAGESSAGIRLLDGFANTITVDGAVQATSRVAIRTDGTTITTVYNNGGDITGDVLAYGGGTINTPQRRHAGAGWRGSHRANHLGG